MEKDQDIESTKQQEEPNGEVIEQSHEPDIHSDKVVVKKSGGGLALLMALIALGISGYLFYKDWLAAREDAGQNKSGEFLQQLNTHKSMSAKTSLEVQQKIEQLTQNISQVETDLSDLKLELSKSSNEQSNDSRQPIEFDNSENEAAIQALQTQIRNQNQLLLSLQNQLADRPIDEYHSEVIPSHLENLQKSAAIQALVSAQTLLDSGYVEMAGSTLENFLMGSAIDNDYYRDIQDKVNEIKRIKQPDSIKIAQQFSSIETAIQNLTITTETEEVSESSWYDRFISVKKIDEGSQIDTSFELLSLKAELSHRIHTAKLLLTLKDQKGWQQLLNQAVELVQQKIPKQQVLANQLQKLADESIIATVPDNLELMTLVDELKGIR